MDEFRLTAENGEPAVVMPVSADTVEQLGADLAPLHEWFQECVDGLAGSRRGRLGVDRARRVLAATAQLLPRLEAIQSAAVRSHMRGRGNAEELAELLGIPQEEVARRRTEAADPHQPFTAWTVYPPTAPGPE